MDQRIDDEDKLAAFDGPITVLEFSVRQHVSMATARLWIKDLTDRGLIRYAGRAHSTGGRRAALFARVEVGDE